MEKNKSIEGKLFPRLATVVISGVYTEYYAYYKELLELDKCDVLLVLGEIANMPGHYAVALRSGKVVYGLHPELFEDICDE
jgi:hypothetical protein